MRRRIIHCAFFCVITIFVWPTTLSLACGPFTLEAIFIHTMHPAYPLERFAKGKLGVLQPTYARSYLYVAYRSLNDTPFNDEEVRSLAELWHDRLDLGRDLGEADWIKSWVTARQKVPGLPEIKEIDVYRHRDKSDEWETYINCTQDAFATAASTLDARIAKYGNDSPAVKDWVLAQDQVFANCSAGQSIPASKATDTDALLQADRDYQLAAANFYASNFDEAAGIFEAIGNNNSSPWQTLSKYMIARVMVRKASLGPADTKQASLVRAEEQLRRILADRKLATLHDQAQRLLNLVRLRLHPADRMHELAHSLLKRDLKSSIKQGLWDYTVLLDSFLETYADDTNPRPNGGIHSDADDLTDWISTFQETSAESVTHAIAKWKQIHSNAWLVAALSKVGGANPDALSLLASANEVQPSSPAFASVNFQSVRLLLQLQRTDEARARLDQLLKTNRSEFDESSLNLLLSKRMMLARNLSEFLTFAPRLPASLSWNDDGREVPAQPSEISDEQKRLEGKPMFDIDAAHALNHELPLVLLKQAAESAVLPSSLRRDVAQAAWMRAVILGDMKTADDLAPVVRSLIPEFSKYLDEFSNATSEDAKQFAATYGWLKLPGLEPIVDSGAGRDTPLNQQDTYRDNWWCSAAFSRAAEGEEDERKSPQAFVVSKTSTTQFLTAAQKAAATREQAALDAVGAGPNYLCRQVIDWATKSPADPRIAEALHLAVMTTRYGCTDQASGRWSKAAFDLLQRNYGNTSWAKKTPYWFKD
ncbi:MAG: hypothetical protein ABR555_08250 [Pyrinomonadaceae bacterium]